jgi:ribonuclease HI
MLHHTFRRKPRRDTLAFQRGPVGLTSLDVLYAVGPSWAAMTPAERERYPALSRRRIAQLWSVRTPEPSGRLAMSAPAGHDVTRSIGELEAWFDGACEPENPGGHGAAGVVVRADNRVCHTAGIYCGSGPGMSNNVTEYRGVITVLEWLANAAEVDVEAARVVHIYGDSQLVVRQLRGEWAARGGLYLRDYQRARVLLGELARRCPGTVELRWIPRTANREADALARGVLEARGIHCRVWRRAPRGAA